jgi:hypothetical protein
MAKQTSFIAMLRLLFSPWLAIFAASAAFADEPPIRLVKDDGGKIVAVEGLGLKKETLTALAKSSDDEWVSSMLRVFVAGAEGRVQPQAMAGKYEVVGDALRFTPAYPLRAGLKYQVHFYMPAPSFEASPAYYQREIVIPASRPRAPTKVTAIYPSAATLPENQLRFYIHFSAPMNRGEAYEHVKLLSADGKAIDRAFLEIGEELWDPSGQRLTLLFDPGRVKQGLKPREEFGPVLEPGKKYVLAVDKGWHDAEGQPLAASFEKRFAAGPMIETAIDPKQWRITAPPARTREALIIRFPRSLDNALARRMITVQTKENEEVAGDVTLADEERRWEFRPEKSWTAGDYSLAIDPALEDPAGNSVRRAFEVDVFEVDKQAATQFVRIPFRVGAGPPRTK